MNRVLAILLVSFATAFSQAPAPWMDPSRHKTSFVKVENDVRLEVLDWGGSGRPLVLLAGAGATAHVFDNFAPKLTGQYHVYGITRRGFGASVYPGSDYGADRLGDDILAVLDSLKLLRPVLVGHSLAGEELSSIASRFPDRVAAVIYLDAAYPYAFDNGKGASMDELRRGGGPRPPTPAPDDLASFSALTKWMERMNGFPLPEAELRQIYDSTSDGRVGKRRVPPGAAGLASGMKKFATIPVPALVIFAVPHGHGPWIKESSDPAVQEAAKTFDTLDTSLTERQAKAIEDAVPTAHVVRIPFASHVIFISNEADVLREMRTFLGRLGRP